MSFDHGVLNVPLRKRINIDAEIDRHKRTQQASAKAAARQNREDQNRAKAAVLALPDERVERIAARAGLTLKQGRKKLISMARWEPTKLLGILAHDEVKS